MDKTTCTTGVRRCKPSIFNYVTTDAFGQVILYNSLSRTLATASDQRAPEVLSLLSGVDASIDNVGDAGRFLLRHGFLVEPDTDEQSLARLRYLEQAMDNDLLLTILPTEQCNFRCRYCYEAFAVDEMPLNIQNGLIRYVQRNISRHNKLLVGWFGGEPLEAPEVIDRLSQKFIDICARNHKLYTATMTTNGYHLTPAMLERMYLNKIRTFTITLDGPKESHDSLRVRSDGHPTFDTIIENLKDIRDAIPRRRVRILVRTNVSREVYNNLDRHLSLLAAEFGQDQRFSFFFRATGDWGGDAVKEITDNLMRPKDYRKVYELLINSDAPLDYQMYIDELTDPRICYAGQRNSYVIGGDGRIYKCTVYFDSSKNVIGQVTEDGTFEIDESKHAPWISSFDTTQSKCGKCTFGAACHGSSCPAPAVIDGGVNPCPAPKMFMNETLRLASKGFPGMPRLS